MAVPLSKVEVVDKVQKLPDVDTPATSELAHSHTNGIHLVELN
jgi:hypothetical protein